MTRAADLAYRGGMRNILLASLAALVFGAPSQPHPTVVFLGDSITANWNLDAAFPDWTVYNAGIGRQDTTQMLARFRHDALRGNPETLYILAGTNDIYFKQPQSVTESNITQMIDIARANGVTVVLCSVLPTEPSNYADRPPERIIALNEWLRATATRYGLQYVDYYSSFVGSVGLTYDGIHPNAAGYAVMRDVLLRRN